MSSKEKEPTIEQLEEIAEKFANFADVLLNSENLVTMIPDGKSLYDCINSDDSAL
jgi:hypothetical protein